MYFVSDHKVSMFPQLNIYYLSEHVQSVDKLYYSQQVNQLDYLWILLYFVMY